MTSVASTATLVARRRDHDADALSDPLAPEWTDVPESSFALVPTPLEAQPSAYVRAAWHGRPRGAIPTISVRAASADGQLLLRLRWAAAEPNRGITDSNVYADACAVLFPAIGHAPLDTMGSPEEPVIAWYWRAGGEPLVSRATGLGTVSRLSPHNLEAVATWVAGEWVVVLSSPLGAAEPVLDHGKATDVAFAAWLGAASERAGLKSYTPSWQTLRIE
jgi:DMSO reductase family type II enzyme heme b subunit